MSKLLKYFIFRNFVLVTAWFACAVVPLLHISIMKSQKCVEDKVHY